jgi:hypothetical protein
MTGDCHVRFCERLRGETPLCLLGERKKIPAILRGRLQSREGAKGLRRRLVGHKVAFKS